MRERKIDDEKLPPILQEYSKFMNAKYRSNDTREHGLYYVLNLHEFLIEKKAHGIEKLSNDDILDYIAELQKKREEGRMSDNSIKIYLTGVKRYAKWLCMRKKWLDPAEYELISEDIDELPWDEAEIAKGRVACTDEEKSILVKLDNLLWYMLVWGGLSYGFRRMEYVNLRTSHLLLDADRPVIIIEKSKGEKTREIPLHPRQVHQWREWLKYRATLNLQHDYVFYNPVTLKPLTRRGLSLIFRKISIATNIHVYSHKLRYTFAVYLYENGVDIFYIALVLGHSNINTTVKYLKIPAEKFFDAYRKATENLF